MFTIILFSCALAAGEGACHVDRVEWLAAHRGAELCIPEVQAAALLTWGQENPERLAVVVSCLEASLAPLLIARIMLPG